MILCYCMLLSGFQEIKCNAGNKFTFIKKITSTFKEEHQTYVLSLKNIWGKSSSTSAELLLSDRKTMR